MDVSYTFLLLRNILIIKANKNILLFFYIINKGINSILCIIFEK